jgi:GNAT superfamily N-acetyltransferase
MDDWWTILRSGLWRLYYKLSREGRARFYGEFLPLLHDTKHEVLGERDEDSFYLVYIGTKPKSRGKGYARLLIEHGTKMVSLFPIYLRNAAAACSYKRISGARRLRRSGLDEIGLFRGT